MDIHDHPKAPKAETTITYKYPTVVTSTAMPTSAVSSQQIEALAEKLMKEI